MEALTHTFSIKVLLTLLSENRRMTIRDIAEKIGETHGSVMHAITPLLESNLIELIQLKDAPYYEEVILTPIGRTVSSKLKEIEELIGWLGKVGECSYLSYAI